MTWLVDHIWLTVELFFAGIWSSAWHKGALYGAILTCVGLAFGSQFLSVIPMVGDLLAKFFAPLRKDLLWAAFACVLILGGEYVGASDAKKECVAKTVVIEQAVDKAVNKASAPASNGWHDPWNSEKN